MNFNVSINDNGPEKEPTYGELFAVSLEAVDATGSTKPGEVMNPGPDFLDKLMERAAYNDKLDAENRTKVLKELKDNGFGGMEDNGLGDSLDPSLAKDLPDNGGSKEVNANKY